jgi:hypothetical protein
MRARASLATTPGVTASTLRSSAEEGKKFGLEADIGGIEHFAARHDDDVEAAGWLVVTENFSNQSFSAIPRHCAPEFSGRGDAESRRSAIRRAREHRHQAPADLAAVFVDALILDTASDVLLGSKCPVGHLSRPRPEKASRQARQRSSETVRRLRPFARRRFSTCWPSLVRMRTRNPCVRLRRRLFGWNVRFPLAIRLYPRRTSNLMRLGCNV